IGGLPPIPPPPPNLPAGGLPVPPPPRPHPPRGSPPDTPAPPPPDLLPPLEGPAPKGRAARFLAPEHDRYGPGEEGERAPHIHEHFGVEVCHADPAELALDGNEVTYQGRVIDLVYRDYAVEDLLELEGEGVDVRPMRQAFATNRVVSSIAAELDQKSCWEVL